jgi:hypothetical protein
MATNKIKKDKREETFFRIVRCCGNCEFFGYYRGKQRRGICWHDMDRPPYKKEIYENYPKTHTTCVCDEHSFSSEYYSFDMVHEWCGAKYMEE